MQGIGKSTPTPTPTLKGSALNLILSHSYPHPMPENLTDDEADKLTEPNLKALILYGIRHFEQKYTTTIEFKTVGAAAAAHVVTGWPYYDAEGLILEAPSTADGYEFPALVTNEEFNGAPQTAYCSIILED